MINESHDVWVWAAAGLLLLLLAARAWVVETGRARLGRTSRQVKTLTGASALVLVGLVTLLGVQGGSVLVSSIINKTNPYPVLYGTGPAAGAAGAPAPTTGG